MEDKPEVMCRGGSAILNPFGSYLAGPTYDREQVLIADLDLSVIEKARMDMDVTGHYARPDLFRLYVNESPQHTVITFAASEDFFASVDN